MKGLKKAAIVVLVLLIISGFIAMTLAINHKSLAPHIHTVVIDEAVAATCTESGLTEGSHCSVCGEVLVEQQEIPAGHTWNEGEITIEPLCTEDGEIIYTCLVCGVTKTEVLPATGHTVVTDEAIAATSFDGGLTEGSHCSVCGVVLADQEEIPATGLTLKATLPEAAYGMGTATVGNKVYLFGGHVGSSYSSAINVFDTELGTINTLSATLDYGAAYMSTAVVGTKIYLFGGLRINWGNSNSVQVFDTETQTILTLPVTLPMPGYGMSSAVDGTKIYLFGEETAKLGWFDQIYVFDTETQTFATLPSNLSKSTAFMGTAQIGNQIYLFGGGDSSGESNFSTIDVFDIETQTVTTISDVLQYNISRVATIAVGNTVFLFGGTDSSSRLNTISVFDPETETITTLSVTMPVALASSGVAIVDNTIYLFGGNSSNGGVDTIYECTV